VEDVATRKREHGAENCDAEGTQCPLQGVEDRRGVAGVGGRDLGERSGLARSMMNETETPRQKHSNRTVQRLVVKSARARNAVVIASPTKPPAISRRGPMRGKRRATNCDEIPMATASGKVESPESIADSPRPSCR
jgi:hypothetical protein